MTTEKPIPVNHNVLVWARNSLALSINETSKKTKISTSRLNELENGYENPTLNELKNFAKIYKRTIATLLLDEVPSEKPLPKDRRTIDSNEIGVFHESTIIAVRKARVFTKSYVELNNESGVNIPMFDYHFSIEKPPHEAANFFRKILYIDGIEDIENSEEVLNIYIEKIQTLGIAVFQISLTQDNVRGFSILDEEIPIIVIKKGSEKPTSKIFTLFHELGHVILDKDGICDINYNSYSKIEKWCNAFAASFLIPSEKLFKNEIVQDYLSRNEKDWVKKDLLEISKDFHVGILALLRALLTNNLTTKEFYQEKHIQWNKPTFGRSKRPLGRNIPKETIQEKGRNYLSMAFNAFDKNKIDIVELSDYVGVKIHLLNKTRQLLNFN